jgi:hypothetical protein
MLGGGGGGGGNPIIGRRHFVRILKFKPSEMVIPAILSKYLVNTIV